MNLRCFFVFQLECSSVVAMSVAICAFAPLGELAKCQRFDVLAVDWSSGSVLTWAAVMLLCACEIVLR